MTTFWPWGAHARPDNFSALVNRSSMLPAEAAGLVRICWREGKGPPEANGRRRLFALVTRCQGAVENE
jgi:hypothetical protein